MTISKHKDKIRLFLNGAGEYCNLKFNTENGCKKTIFPSVAVERVGNVRFVTDQNRRKIEYTYLVRILFGYTAISDFEEMLNCFLCTLMMSDLTAVIGAKAFLQNHKGEEGVLIDDNYLFDECNREAQAIQFFIQILDKPCN